MLRVDAEPKALFAKLSSSSFALTASSSSDDDGESDINNNNNNYPVSENNAYGDDDAEDLARELLASGGGGNQETAQLADENAQLRRQVADLTSALVVRDMEIASLQERCQLLLASVEQQDEVIAKIYAVAAPGTATSFSASSMSSAPVLIPTPANDVHRQRHSHGFTALFNSKRDSASHHTKTTSEQRYVRTSTATATSSDNAAAVEPARELLEAQLDSIGYQPQEAADALEALTEGAPLFARTSSVVSAGESAGVGMLDRLVFSSPPKSEPLFGGTAGSSRLRTTITPRSAATSPDVSFGKTHRRSSFLERQSSDEDFAKSAGFLRKANRKLSGRLSVSDFGLLSDDTSLSGRSAPNEQSSDPASIDQPEDDVRDVPDRSAKRVQRRTASQRNLFAEIDVATSEDVKRKEKESNGSGEKEAEDELTYAAFLECISLPASRDILNRIRVFVGSVLGPRGDGKPPRASDYVDYDFYGHHEFPRRYERFFRKMDELLAIHPAWRHASETTLSKARDGIEKYVMDKLCDIAFNQLPACQQWKQEDDKLFRRMKLLSFVTPDMLDIKPCMRNEVVWSMAEDELRRINSFRAPGDKINCVVRCCSVIFSVLNLSRGDSGSRPGADDFLPVFIYIVLHSQIPRLCSNCEYIAAYRNPADLMSKAGYCFVNLRSAIEFINVLDASMLSISADEFDREHERLLHEQNGNARR